MFNSAHGITAISHARAKEQKLSKTKDYEPPSEHKVKCSGVKPKKSTKKVMKYEATAQGLQWNDSATFQGAGNDRQVLQHNSSRMNG